MLEESNSIGTMARTTDLAGHFLEPLARDIKQNISANLLVWASPYFVANLTRHPLTVRHFLLSFGRIAVCLIAAFHKYMVADWSASFEILDYHSTLTIVSGHMQQRISFFI